MKKYFIGIDLSKLTFDVVIYDPKTQKAMKHFKTNNDLKGFNTFIRKLKEMKIKLGEAFVCLEYCGVYGLEIGFFMDGKIDYCFCNPLHIKRSLGLTRGKSDKLDALKISRFCYLFRDELSPQKMPSDVMLKLKALMSERARIVKSKVIEKQVLNELKSSLSDATISRIKNRLKILEKDERAVEKEILELIKSDNEISKNYSLITTIVGISLVNATTMILCTNNFKGIDNPRSFACYCGVAPFEYTSGTSIRGKTRVSHLANKKVKSDLTNAARSSIVHDPEMKQYYKRKLDEGKEYGTVMNAVKFKLITRVFAVVKRGTPYVKLKQAG